jgi:hypothetical protein
MGCLEVCEHIFNEIPYISVVKVESLSENLQNSNHAIRVQKYRHILNNPPLQSYP